MEKDCYQEIIAKVSKKLAQRFISGRAFWGTSIVL